MGIMKSNYGAVWLHLRWGRIGRYVVASSSLGKGRFTKIILLVLIILAFIAIKQKPASTLPIDIPLDQALVLAGGESTNPRDYDPATTLGGGDKLIFSGLISLNPKLMLKPDLAEKWDTNADGTVYTFHLRPNANFMMANRSPRKM